MTDLQHFSPVEKVSPAQRRRRAPLVIGAVAAAALAFGGASVAYAATDSASSSSTDAATTDERPAHEPHLHGTVVSVSGSTITITNHDGFTRVINTSGDTAYTDGLTADLAAGTEIRASGTVNADGTSLDATKVDTAPTPGDGPGKGGPLGDGERPTPPTGAPTPTDDATDDAGTNS